MKTRLLTERVNISKERNWKREAKMWRLSQMDFSFSCEESLGVCFSEDSPCDLNLTDYIASCLMHCNLNSNHQVTLMGTNGNPFVNTHTCLSHRPLSGR